MRPSDLISRGLASVTLFGALYMLGVWWAWWILVALATVWMLFEIGKAFLW